MGLLNKLLGSKKKRTADETFLKDMVIEEQYYNVIKLFHKKTANNNIELSLTDKEIVYVSKAVFDYFPQVAKNRGEELHPHILFYIAELLMYKYQKLGKKFYLRNLQYELDKYGKKGLRQDYIDGSHGWSSY